MSPAAADGLPAKGYPALERCARRYVLETLRSTVDGDRPAPDTMIENRTFDEIAVGDSASVSRTVSQQDIDLFAVVSGDVNPAHMDPAYAETDMFHKVIAHGMWGGGLISAVLGTKLPGPGTIYLGQDLRFLHPVEHRRHDHGDADRDGEAPGEGRFRAATAAASIRTGETVITGTAHVRAPTEKVRRAADRTAGGAAQPPSNASALCWPQRPAREPLATAVAHPCDANALGAAVEAAQRRTDRADPGRAEEQDPRGGRARQAWISRPSG